MPANLLPALHCLPQQRLRAASPATPLLVLWARVGGLGLALLAAGLASARAQQLYVVRDGQLPYAGHTQASANVVVNGPLDQTRAFFQDYLKDTYRVTFKGGLLGKKATLTAKPATSSFASRPLELVASFTALTDSTTEVALFGSFDEKDNHALLTPEATPAEYQRLREALTRFAPAARYYAYQQQVLAAEAEVAAADKEQGQLSRSIESAQRNTAANLRRIDELLRQNQANAAQMRQDSAQLVVNAQRGTTARQQVQRRRARLATTAPR